jgi:cysteinyl-tRNA synthetase
VKLCNTASRKIEEFKPLKKGHVGIYSCGPTVYWNQHLGHMYAYIQWDVLIRFFKYLGYQTKWVMNITDVGHLTSDEDIGEDKIEKGAKREGLTVWQIAKKYTKQFLESLKLLNINKPDVLPRATEHIQDQIDLIKKIEKNGFTYKTKTGIVFDTSKFADYTKFANLDLEKLQAGKRVEIDRDKKQPWDFLLWVTNQPNHIMQWDSPWGRGFPGWHIECTAMSTKYLGERFDIHTGGIEHIPVHHSNEIAQAFGAFGHSAVNYWLHNEWLAFKGEKMSKSSGGFILVTDLIKKGYDPLAFRYLVLNSHYRTGLDFTWQALKGAQAALGRLRNIVSDLREKKDKKKNSKKREVFRKAFLNALENDLNIPQALAVLWEVVKSNLGVADKLTLIFDFDKVLGLGLKEYQKEKVTIPQKVKSLVKERDELREKEKWQKADEIRKKMAKLGWQVKDTKKKTIIEKK